MNAKFTALSRKVEAIELCKVNVVSNTVPSEPIREMICVVCDSRAHNTADCPSIPAYREVVQGQTNAINAYIKPIPNEGGV